ncbi:hypothetical protein NLG97_g1417 [Lecanicillium saksenae]|uniref:Uncharacterized protein n=1 Tax=Lecanicillium saksenae TaxID=468837 RepID=A0ACC1R5Q2_9HYPO|nr:hypothetical protein NLG97_g1417 [Lecanicillium saksenae]
MVQNDITEEKQNSFDSSFKVGSFVRSLTPPPAYQTTPAPRAHGDGPDATGQSENTEGEAENYSFMTAAIRPFLAALNASTLGPRSLYPEGSADFKILALEGLDEPQMQILKRTPAVAQNLEPHRLMIALMLSLMMATYGWKIGSYSGLKCCVFLLFLVYFRLRSIHNTPN